MLPDGTYDAFVVDAEDDDTGVRLELTVIAGPHKGDVVSVRRAPVAEGAVERDALDLIGMPATLTVSQGRPRVAIDDV